MLLAGSPATAQEFMKSAKEQADLYSKERQKLEQLFSQQSKSAGSAGVRAQEQACPSHRDFSCDLAQHCCPRDVAVDG